MRGHALLLAGALAAALLGSQTSQAAEGDEAHRLFVEGRDALKRGDQSAACEKFRASLALARVPNTLFNVAQCDERDGELTLALQGLREGIGLLSAGDERLPLAKERLAAVEARTPMITLAVASPLPTGARLLVDGAATALPAQGAPLPLDPGEHTLAVEAPGRATARFAVTLAERDRKEIAISAGPLTAASAAPSSAGGPPVPPPGIGSRRAAGLVTLSLGVAGLAAFGITGGLILDRDSHIKDACPDKACTPEGRELINGSGPWMIANAITFGVGLAGVGVGATLLFTSRGAPATATLAPAALPGGGGAIITGRF